MALLSTKVGLVIAFFAWTSLSLREKAQSQIARAWLGDEEKEEKSGGGGGNASPPDEEVELEDIPFLERRRAQAASREKEKEEARREAQRMADPKCHEITEERCDRHLPDHCNRMWPGSKCTRAPRANSTCFGACLEGFKSWTRTCSCKSGAECYNPTLKRCEKKESKLPEPSNGVGGVGGVGGTALHAEDSTFDVTFKHPGHTGMDLQEHGYVVQKVRCGGQADVNGIQQGDKLIELRQGDKLIEVDGLSVNSLLPGVVELWLDEAHTTAKFKRDKSRNKQDQSTREDERFFDKSAVVTRLPPGQKYFKLQEDMTVLEVMDRGPAALRFIEPGLKLVELDGQSVRGMGLSEVSQCLLHTPRSVQATFEKGTLPIDYVLGGYYVGDTVANLAPIEFSDGTQVLTLVEGAMGEVVGPCSGCNDEEAAEMMSVFFEQIGNVNVNMDLTWVAKMHSSTNTSLHDPDAYYVGDRVVSLSDSGTIGAPSKGEVGVVRGACKLCALNGLDAQHFVNCEFPGQNVDMHVTGVRKASTSWC